MFLCLILRIKLQFSVNKYTMFSKQPGKLVKKLDIEFLQCSYEDHERAVRECAELQIHSLDLIMPKFNNTLACLSKTEFNKFMSTVALKYKQSNMFIVIVGVILDTLTCMIKNSIFYEDYANNNTVTLNLMMDLLSKIHRSIVFGSVIDPVHLTALIEILETSVERIKHEYSYYEKMQDTISILKLQLEKKINKENKLSAVQVETDKHLYEKFDNILNSSDKTTKNITHYLQPAHKNINVSNKRHDTCLSNNNSITADNLSTGNKDKLKNAFELMMMSSKSLKQKKKIVS